jgi:hypothetical protein
VTLPCLAPQQEGVGVGHGFHEVGADVVVPVVHGPSTMLEAARGIFFLATRRLNYTVD